MTADRRTAARRTPAADETLARLRLRTGRELAVVNIGDAGALVGHQHAPSTVVLPGLFWFG